jgi:hypothetical protein
VTRAIVLLPSILVACSRSPAEPPTPNATGIATVITSAAPFPTPTPTPTSTSTSTALGWADPPRWQRRHPSNAQRTAEYLVPRAGDDPQDGECIVITFGAGQGGSVESNVDRWVHQYEPVTTSPAKRSHEVNGMTITRVEVAGTYHPMQMPGAPPAPSSIPNSRLIGGIVQAPSGLWFFKLTGSDATVRASAAEFDAMVDSVRAK